jgi:hypothetical protein
LVRFGFRMWEILIFKWFLLLKNQINSNNQVLEGKINWERGNTWANGTGHTSCKYQGHNNMWTLNLDNLLKSCPITLHGLDEHDPSERALLMQLVMFAHEIKNHKLNVCCKINPQTSQQLVVSTFMQVQECLEVFLPMFLFQV